MPSKTEILEREQRWRLVAGIAAVAGVALIVASLSNSIGLSGGKSGLAEALRGIEGDHGRVIAGGVVQMIGWSLLAIPLVFLFRAAAARAPKMRSSLVILVAVAPVLLGASWLIGNGSLIQASDQYAQIPAGEFEKCIQGKVEKGSESAKGDSAANLADEKNPGGAKNESAAPKAKAVESKPSSSQDSYREDCENEVAEDVARNVSLSAVSQTTRLMGLMGFTISVVYTALWAMRTGLLGRTWGSLGIALGAVFVLFWLFSLGWFIYVGLLLAGWVPGGRPPAWAAGVAVQPPQSKGGGLFGPRHPLPQTDDDGPVDKWGEPIEGTSDELEPDQAPEPEGLPEAQGDGSSGNAESPRRKRKKRNG